MSACWICLDADCGGWLCWSAEMPHLTPAELMVLDRPRLCVWCERQPAMVGDGSNYCEGCRPQSKYGREPSDREQADREAIEQSAFEQEHRWGASIGKHGDGLPTTDYGRGE